MRGDEIMRFKKMLWIVIIIAIAGLLLQKVNLNKNITDIQQKEISDKLIRFHVIANSDSKQDQQLKLMVRDKVLEYIYPRLKDSKSIEQSRKILLDNDKKIKEICENTIRNNKYNYAVTTALSKENFPVKTYGNITLPQGQYEAYRIIIGGGEGQNWWCVMFPPLCFIDITKEETSYKETENEMKKTLSEKQYKAVDNRNKSPKEVKFRFKIFDALKDMINNMSNKSKSEKAS